MNILDQEGSCIDRIYAGWLGKNIGIRLGAPIEGWTYERIENIYGEIDGYPVAYKNFAADDDSNGPTFFVRALEDCADIEQFSSSDVAQALLNYAPFEHGFFWWGGYGISTEHTAYLNLRSGIPAPRSGSIEQNGSAVAEQIGGQIFIDCWGLVAPGNPELAASLAEKAASVTHGGNGIFGGIYVACCISMAFAEKDIRVILEKALSYIPDDCEYARVVRAVMEFHRQNPDNWRDCFQYLYSHFGYDKYPGNCHIIPNAGVMILSMLYGNGDFSRTINICNMCGWDTDCNVGNVGCIMGVLCGLEGIDYEKWRAPINDFLVCSGVVPSLNTTDLPSGASYFSRLAYQLAKQEIPAQWKDALENRTGSCHFEYPGSTHAIRGRCENGRYRIKNTDEQAGSGKRSLKIVVCDSFSGAENYFYKQTYYGSEDFDDSRYDPSFSPLVYPGQTVHLSVMPCRAQNGMSCDVQIYVKNGATGEIIRGQKIAGQEGSWHTLSLKIPDELEGYISETGIIISGASGGFDSSDLTVYLDDLYYDGTACYPIRFHEGMTENWNGQHKEIHQFSKLKGIAYLDGESLSLSCSDFAEIYTGHHDWQDCSVSCTLKPVTGEEHYINVRVQGAMRSYAGGFSAGGKLCLKKNRNGYACLCETDYALQPGREYRLTLSARGNTVSLSVDGVSMLSYTDEDFPLLKGCIGLSVFEGSHCLYRDLSIHAETKESAI